MRSSLKVPQFTSPLLRLPGELRNEIYAYVFSGIKWPLTSWPDQPHTDRMTFSALPSTCRQLRAESRLLPYRYAEYEIWGSFHFCNSLIPLDEEAQAVVCDALTKEQRHVLLQCRHFATIYDRIHRQRQNKRWTWWSISFKIEMFGKYSTLTTLTGWIMSFLRDCSDKISKIKYG